MYDLEFLLQVMEGLDNLQVEGQLKTNKEGMGGNLTATVIFPRIASGMVVFN
jgi:hypothetical protein